MAAAKKGGLGRGLDALFADAVPVSDPLKEEKKQDRQKSKVEMQCSILISMI